MIFDDREVAEYYTEAFNVDWNRPDASGRRAFKTEAVVHEAVGDATPPAFKRVPLSEVLEADD